MKKSQLDFDNVYEEFHKKISRYLERMVGKGQSEDLTQEVFMKVNKGLQGFKGESSLSTWIYRLATNAALDKLRSRSFRENNKNVAIDITDEESQKENSSACIDQKSLSAEREAIRKEMNDCIREFVDRLPGNYRTVIILSELKDLKNQQIAEILGISLEAVKIRLHRARVKLKEEFEIGCTFYNDENNEIACDRKNEKTEK